MNQYIEFNNCRLLHLLHENRKCQLNLLYWPLNAVEKIAATELLSSSFCFRIYEADKFPGFRSTNSDIDRMQCTISYGILYDEEHGREPRWGKRRRRGATWRQLIRQWGIRFSSHAQKHAHMLIQSHFKQSPAVLRNGLAVMGLASNKWLEC